MDKVAVKIISTVVLFFMTLLGAIVPYFFLKKYLSKDKKRADDKIKLLKSFAAGVFLGTCFLHLLPEARSELLKVLGELDYPVTELIVVLGFLLLFAIENTVLYCQDLDERKNKEGQESVVRFIPFKEKTDQNSRTVGEQRPNLPTHLSNESVGNSIEVEPNYCNSDGGSLVTSLSQKRLCKRKENKPLLESNVVFSEVGISSDNAFLLLGEHHHRSRHKNITGMRSIMLVMALSLHTVFDGLVIGLQSSTVLVWTLLVTVSLHKVLVSFSLGLSFLESHFNKVKEAMVYLFLFSIVAPVGVVIGTVVTEVDFNQEAKYYSSGMLQSIATGTFMYVTFMEGLKESFCGKYHLLNVFMVLASFGCVCALRYAADDE